MKVTGCSSNQAIIAAYAGLEPENYGAQASCYVGNWPKNPNSQLAVCDFFGKK